MADPIGFVVRDMTRKTQLSIRFVRPMCRTERLEAAIADRDAELAKMREALDLAWAVIGMSAEHCEECFARPATRKGTSFAGCDGCKPEGDGETHAVLVADQIRAAEAARAALASPPAPTPEG